MAEVTELIQAWQSGDHHARDRLSEMIYADLHSSAVGIIRRQWSSPRLQPTELVHESFLKLFALDRIHWQDRSHLLAMAATVMRQILIDHYRRERADKREHQAITLVSELHEDGPSELQFDDLDEALRALADAEPDYARVVEMKFFAGMTHEEISIVLQVSERTVKRYWRGARAWLEVELADRSSSHG